MIIMNGVWQLQNIRCSVTANKIERGSLIVIRCHECAPYGDKTAFTEYSNVVIHEISYTVDIQLLSDRECVA